MDPTLVLGAITALDRLRDPFDDPTTTRPVRRPGKPDPSTPGGKRRRGARRQ
jgi:hypothetical protein